MALSSTHALYTDLVKAQHPIVLQLILWLTHSLKTTPEERRVGDKMTHFDWDVQLVLVPVC